MPRSTQPQAVRSWPHFALCGGLLLCFSSAQSAIAQSPEGTYEASPARVTANIEKWGKDCGVRPTSYTLKQQPKVPVRVRGKQLLLQFPSGVLRTDQCWSKNPGLSVQTTRAEGSSWWTRCSTPEGDPKSEAGVYEVVLTDALTLRLTEVSRYDWQLKDSHCVASVQIERTLRRMGEAAVTTESSSATPESPPPAPDSKPTPRQPPAEDQAEMEAETEADPLDKICLPGPATKLRLSPRAVTAEPGQRVCFSVRATDASGCALRNPKPLFSVQASGPGQGSMRGDCFVSASSAAEGEDTYRVIAKLGTTSARATVHVRTPDLSDITAHNVLGEGSPLAQPVPEPASATPHPVKTQIKAHSVTEREVPAWMWMTVSLSGVLILGASAWLATRRGAAQRSVPQPVAKSLDRDMVDSEPPPPMEASVTGIDTSATEAMICPKCRHGYPPGTQRCTKDETPLITYTSFNAPTEASRQLACKVCGATFKGDTVFCGKCGARLN